MNALMPIRTAPTLYSAKQLDLIRRTVAADCNPPEFDLYIEVCKRVGLDPFRKQIYAVVYSKDNAAKRKMSIITGIDGFRAVAARNRNYRPAEDEPRYEVDEALKSSKNPLGLIKAVVKCFQLGPDNVWYPVMGEAYWDEFAPIKMAGEDGDMVWVESGQLWPEGTPKAGQPKMKKVPKDGAVVSYEPEGKWKTMPHVMLSKCAEAQALRRGWPEDLSGVYAPEEMDQARNAEVIDTTASEVADRFNADKKLEAMGGRNALAIVWEPTGAIEMIPVGQFADRCAEFIGKCQSVPDVDGWREMNRVTLQRFWADHKSDALALKKIIEDRITALAGANMASAAA